MGFSIETSVSAVTVFLQGALSFFSPCVLPQLPLYVSYLAGGAAVVDADGVRRYPRGKIFLNTLFFVVGISFAFFLLGLGLTALGSFFSDYQVWFARASGVIILLFGLYQLGLGKRSLVLEREHRLPFRLDKLAMNPVTALVLGFTFSFAWTPCVGPTLSSVLLMASSAESSAAGFLLIGVYTLGFVLPFLAVGLFTGAVLDFFKSHQNVVRYTVKIGAVLLIVMGILTLTGAASIYGLAAYRGAQIAVNEINSEGGDIQFELNYQDDQNVPETAVNAFNNLKDWGMQISLGSVTTQPGIATSQYNFEDRIFALTPSASSPDVISGKDNVYQMCFSDPNQGLASAQYIYEQNLGENVYIIWKNDDVYSTGIKDQFVAEAEELGLNIVGDSTFTEDTKSDFTVQLTDAQQKGADLIFLPMYYQPASLILTQADSMGYEPKFFGVDGMDGILTMEGFDASLAEGVMLLTPFNADATDDATVAFVTEYESLYGETPNQFAADAYDCIYALKLALETAGCTPDMTAEAINDALIAAFPTITLTGLTGDGQGITWDSTGAVSKAPKGMVIENGAYVGMD